MLPCCCREWARRNAREGRSRTMKATSTYPSRETVKHPGTKGAVRWVHHTSVSSEVWDSTAKKSRHAVVFECGRLGWRVVDRTGLQPGEAPVQDAIYQVATPYAAWELFRAERCG